MDLLQRILSEGNSSILPTALDAFFAQRPDLKLLEKKALVRKDNKVPPGSNSIRRSIDDERFLLCLSYIELGKFYSFEDQRELALEVYRKSLVWFPKSIEGNLLYAQLQKTIAATPDHILSIETLLRKAIQSYKELQSMHPTGPTLHPILQIELSCGKMAMEDLILLLCQEGKSVEAEWLLHSQGFTVRLADPVLEYSFDPATPSTSPSCNSIVKAIDNALAPHAITHLQHVFRAASPFWREHEYDKLCNASRRVGYFSYIYPIKTRSACCSIETIIDQLFPIIAQMFPTVASDCNYGINLRFFTLFSL